MIDENIEFQIRVQCPIGLTVDLARDIVTEIRPKWRVDKIDLKKIDENVFEIRMRIAQGDLFLENPAALLEFRDCVLSLLAFTAMSPLRPLTFGLFTFPRGERKYAQISLGGTNRVFSPTIPQTLASLVEGLALRKVYLTALRFFWQALNSDVDVDRFINLAIACELIIGADSKIGGSRNPRCTVCGSMISKCPKCKKELRIPTTLRERGAFLLQDEGSLTKFIDFRNTIFHGGLAAIHPKTLLELRDLNDKVMVAVRNYLGQLVKLGPISRSDLSLAVNAPDIYMTVYYTLPPQSKGSEESTLTP